MSSALVLIGALALVIAVTAWLEWRESTGQKGWVRRGRGAQPPAGGRLVTGFKQRLERMRGSGPFSDR